MLLFGSAFKRNVQDCILHAQKNIKNSHVNKVRYIHIYVFLQKCIVSEAEISIMQFFSVCKYSIHLPKIIMHHDIFQTVTVVSIDLMSMCTINEAVLCKCKETYSLQKPNLKNICGRPLEKAFKTL